MNFNRVMSGLYEEADAILSGIDKDKVIWDWLTLRTAFEGSPHREAQDVALRGPLLRMGRTLADLQEEVLCYNYDVMGGLPFIYQTCLNIMYHVRGEALGRVVVTKLKPGGKIYPHKDQGEAADIYDRYHLVIKGDEGNTFIVNGEEQVMRVGELWWVNNHNLHSVENRGKEERIHLIIDVLRFKPENVDRGRIVYGR